MSAPRAPRTGDRPALSSASETAASKGGKPRLDLGRRRAKRAWEWVEAARNGNEKGRDDYASLSQKLPSMLQVSGLGQTLAYLYGKGYKAGQPTAKAEGLLLKQLGEYLRETYRPAQPPGGDPMAVMLALEPHEYRDASREIAATAEWLKRFAEGQLKKGSAT